MTKFLDPTRPKPLLPSALNSHVNRETSKSVMYRPEQLEKRVLGSGGGCGILYYNQMEFSI